MLKIPVSQDSLFLLKKNVDRSLLRQGFTISTQFHALIHSLSGGVLPHGQERAIKILIDGILYDARLINQGFRQEDYPGHPDVLQVRYNPTSPVALKLQEIFSQAFEYLNALHDISPSKKQLRLPPEMTDYIAFFVTTQPNVFAIECFTTAVNENISNEVLQMEEEQYELLAFMPQKDDTAKIVAKTVVQKCRRLDDSIGNSLKKLYDWRCQMTGERIGEQQGGCVAEVHHIDFFTRSLNNDSSNIIILSPNYHRIIHKNNPVFHRDTLSFEFPNGLIEKVKLNKHLNV